MKRKSLLFLLLLALGLPWAADAQTVTIGTGTSAQNSAPIANYYNYSMAEMIFTADEIGTIDVNTILSLGFQCTTNVSRNYGVTVYMKNIEADAFTATTDFITLSATDVVFTGTVSPTSGWTTIDLPTPFTYNRTGNLLIAVNKTSGGYDGSTAIWNYTSTSTTYKMLYGQNDSSPGVYDPTTTLSLSLNYNRPNVQLVFGAPASTPKPTGLAVSGITHNEATLSWTENGTATSWQYCLNGDEEHPVTMNTNPYTLTGLTTLTSYTVKVRSVGNNEYSDWSNEVSFNTTAQATAVGDGWSDDFEGTTCGWELINGTLADAWVWGTATNNGGTHAIYISDDGGTTWNYSHNSVKVLAAKLLNFSDGKFSFSYDWNCYGESNYDFLRVALVPASQILTAGSDYSTISTTSLPSGWIALDGGGKLNQVQTWQNKEVAVNVTAGNYYLVLAWRSDSSTQNQPPAAVDNVSITRVACAYDVEGLAVDNVTTNSATLTWTAGEAEQWQVAFADNGNFDNATEAIVSAATYNMTGLQPATRYYARVRAYCGGQDFGAWSSVFDFFTDCAIIPAVGYTENFDSYTAAAGVLPICWNKINTTTYSSYQGYPRIYNYSSQSSPNCLYFYSYYSSSYDYYDPQDQYAILPEMENLAGKLITLSARANSNTVTFKIGLMTDPADASTFTEMATQALTTSYQEFEYVVPANATAHYIAIMMEAASSSSTTRYIYIDDIAITEAPTCFKPNGLTYSNVYGHGATLSWLLNDETQTAWDVQVATDADFEEVVQLIENVNNHENYVLSGLDPETHYYVRVRANCGGGDVSEWSNTVNFTTTVACPAPTGFAASEISGYTAKLNWTGYSENYTVSYRTAATAIGFFEAFNTSGIPTGWTQYSGLVDEVLAGTAQLTSGSNWSTTTTGLGAYNAKLNIYGTSRKNWLVTPEVTLENGYNLDFDLALTDYGNSDPIEDPTAQADDRFVVLVYADEAWTILREWNNTGSENVYNTIATRGEHVSINLSAYVGKTVKIAFYGESTVTDNGDNDLHIDNVIVGIPVAAGQWQTVTVDEAPVILTDLTPETTYEAKVQGNCGDDGLSLESNVITFTTLDACPTPTGLAVVDSLLTATSAGLRWNGSIDVDSYTVQYRTAAHDEAPFMQDFESETSLNGWTFIGDDVNGIDATGTYHAGLHTTAAHSGSYGFRFSSYTSSEDYNQYLISPELTVTGELKFWYKMYGTGDELNFGYSTTTDDVESFTWFELTNTTTWQEFTQVLSADVKYIAIHYYGDYKFYGYVDDITIGAYEVPAGEWQTASSTTTNVTLTGLTPETPYEAQVKSDCSDPEAWSNMITFTTLEAITYTLTIEGYEDDNNAGGYYLIASPVTVDLTNHEMTTGDFDLYYFDQAQDDEWRNYETQPFNLEPGKGYLYAHKTGGVFTLTGVPYSGNGVIDLDYDGDAQFAGWNLVGNPWSVKATTERSFYTLEGGASINPTPNLAGTEINPMTGIFVVAEGENKTVTFSTVNPGSKSANLALNLTNSNKLVDRAIVRFGEGQQLLKFQLNPNHTKVYIPMGGNDYAIVNATEMGEMPVSFKAESNGNYTLSVNAEEVSFAYLHLIDNMTGIETDLLANPSYSFEASTTDYASRFKLVFATGDNSNEDNFAFFSNGSFVINNEGEATLQVVDVMGRIIKSESINGCANVNVNAAPGVYMIRLINGENVKVQKVVVR